MLLSDKDVPISVQEAILFWGKSKKQVYYAMWKDLVKARQSVCSENWIISLDSCIALWGEPVMLDLVQEVRNDWYENKKLSG